MARRKQPAAVAEVSALPHDCYEVRCEADLPIDLPFSLSCMVCDCDSPDSYAQAVLRGWTEIIVDRTGLSWNFLGFCPDHQNGGDE